MIGELVDRLATWGRVRLLPTDAAGRPRPVGGDVGVEVQAATGEPTRVTVIGEGDSLDLFWKLDGREELLAVSVPRVVALRLAWFILWRWWGRAHWFGLRRRIWDACSRRVLRIGL